MATLLVQSGVLSKGDIVLVGDEFGKIRSMIDDTQKQITSAGPSSPLVILGLPKTQFQVKTSMLFRMRDKLENSLKIEN